MVEKSKHEISETIFIRVTLAQLDYQPSVVLATPSIEEPSNFFIGHMQDQLAPAIFGNVSTMITFHLGEMNAESLVKEMGKPVESEELVNLKNYHALAKTLIKWGNLSTIYAQNGIETT